MMNDERIAVCVWPVTLDHPSGNSGEDCPEPNCTNEGGHTDDHSGEFRVCDLELVEPEN